MVEVLELPVTTDPAMEFATLIKSIKDDSETKGVETYKGLASFIGVDTRDTRFLEILGLIGSRAVALVDFISVLKDEYLDEDLRSSLITGVRNAALITSPANLMQPYNQIVNGCINDADVRLIRSFSQTARRYRPLRVLDDGQRTKLSEAVDDAIKELASKNDIPRWTISSLEESIRRLKMILQYFRFFGHDAAFDQLIRIQGEAKASSSVLQRMGQLSQHNLVRTAGLISLCVSLLLMPMNVEKGYLFYRSHIHEIVQEVPPLLGGPIARLTHRPVASDEATSAEQSPPSSQPPETDQ